LTGRKHTLSMRLAAGLLCPLPVHPRGLTMRASKTAGKRQAEDAQHLGKELLDVPADVLGGLGLEPELLEALEECRRHRGHKEFRRLMQGGRVDARRGHTGGGRGGETVA
jgi:hypothetical protein